MDQGLRRQRGKQVLVVTEGPRTGGQEPGRSALSTQHSALILPRRLAEEMLAHARREVPNEACGILAGKSGRPTHFYVAANAEHSPTRYVVDPSDQLRIMNHIYSQGCELVGIFHSHTHTQAYPSSTDISLAANWPDAYYVIASLQNEPPVLRAFRILDGTVTEEEIAYAEGM